MSEKREPGYYVVQWREVRKEELEALREVYREAKALKDNVDDEPPFYAALNLFDAVEKLDSLRRREGEGRWLSAPD